MDDAELKSTHPALTVIPLQTGLWRVKEHDGEKLLDLYHKGAAVYFATNWARSHALAEVLVYTEQGDLEEIVRVSLQAVAWQS